MFWAKAFPFFLLGSPDLAVVETILTSYDAVLDQDSNLSDEEQSYTLVVTLGARNSEDKGLNTPQVGTVLGKGIPLLFMALT